MDALTRLAEDARAGDKSALEGFVAASYGQVWRFCASLVDEHSAEDLAQETFIRAIRALPQFRGGSSARTWLLAIARNSCLDELRSRSGGAGATLCWRPARPLRGDREMPATRASSRTL